MSLKIQEYTRDDIIEVLDLTKKDTYHLDEIVHATTQTLHNIYNNDDSVETTDKDILRDFIVKCFDKICNIEHIIIPESKSNIYEMFYKSNNLNKNVLQSFNEKTKTVNVFEQNDNQIIVHGGEKISNSFSNKYKEGVANPLKKQSYNYILNINSLFRKNYTETNSTDYSIVLPNPIKNVLSMRLVSTEIPNSIYQYSSFIGTNEITITSFDISGGTEILNTQTETFYIPNGNYNIDVGSSNNIVDYLNVNVFNTSPWDRIISSYDAITGKIRFSRNSSVPDPSINYIYAFDLDFTITDINCRNKIDNVGMGWLLGFRKLLYTWYDDYVTTLEASSSVNLLEGYTGESTFNCGSIKYILLHINDFNKNHTKVFETPLQHGLINSSDIMAKIPVFNSNLISNTQALNTIINNRRDYFGPVNVEKLEIRLYDEFGRIIDLNNCDYSFSLEIDCLYDL